MSHDTDQGYHTAEVIFEPFKFSSLNVRHSPVRSPCESPLHMSMVEIAERKEGENEERDKLAEHVELSTQFCRVAEREKSSASTIPRVWNYLMKNIQCC